MKLTILRLEQLIRVAARRTAGLLLESLGVAVPLLIIWFVRFRKPDREAAVAPRRPARRPPARPAAAKRRR